MTTLNQIKKFLESKEFAIAGASRNSKKFGGAVFKELKEKGFTLHPINPNTDEIQGQKCFKSVLELPDDVNNLFIVTPRQETQKVVNAAIQKGVKLIWIQQKSETPEAVKTIEDAGIPLIHNKCIFMFADPVKGPHNFHRFFVKLFGGYPKLVYTAN